MNPLMMLKTLAWFTLMTGLAPCGVGEPLRVVTTIFPLFDWAREIGADRVHVHQLLRPGMDAHAFAPRPSDLRAIHQADIFVYLNAPMEPWAADLIRGIEQDTSVVVAAGDGLVADPCKAQSMASHTGEPPHGGDHGHTDHDHAHGNVDTDPHVWLDPLMATQMVARIAQALGDADPANIEFYTANAAHYNARIMALHHRIHETLSTARHHEILYGGHFAFGHFTRRYGLRHRSPFPGFAPNAQPSPRSLAAVIDALKQSGMSVIFHEEMADPRLARIIAEETGARLMLLHGLHNLSREERDRGETYLSLMEFNLRQLREGLACQ